MEKRMQPPRHMRISELSAYTHTPAATIRYYVRQGLLPEPVRTGKTMAYYTEEHLERLIQIQRLKGDGLSLMAIGKIVKGGERGVAHGGEADIVFTSKRDEIVRAAVALFRNKGYDATSVADIVGRAGVGKGTFYQHFRNKENLFLECADSVFYDIGRDVPEIREETDAMKRLWKRAYHFAHFYRHMIDMLNLARGASVKENSHFREKLNQAVRNLTDPIQADLDMAIAQGSIAPMDSRLIAHLLMGAIEYCLYYYIEYQTDIERLLMKGWEIVFNDMFLGGTFSGKELGKV
jgi:AcrR family transcriptional regulator